MKDRRGFTLIELLIVIAIIGILSGILFVSIGQGPLKRARDSKRKSDLNQIRFALELYFQDKGYYPQSNCGWDCNDYRYSTDASWNALAADLAPYISSLPKDPINNSPGPWGGGAFSYSYGNVGRNGGAGNPSGVIQYDLTAQLEDTSDPDRCGVKDYHFYFDNRHWCTAFGGGYDNQIYEASPR